MKFPRNCPHYDNAAKLILWKEPGIPMPIPFPKEDVSLLSNFNPLWYYITFSLEIYGLPHKFPHCTGTSSRTDIKRISPYSIYRDLRNALTKGFLQYFLKIRYMPRVV